jgi:hypothetical protein
METTIEKSETADETLDGGMFSPPPCSACRFVYVVASGGYRFAVESEIPLSFYSAFKAALPRFESLGCYLGSILEITECSDNADPSNPHYIETISALKMLGKFSEPNARGDTRRDQTVLQE